jgi:hypothetical protein
MATGSNRKAVKTWLQAIGRKPRLPIIGLAAFFLCPEALPAQTAAARIPTGIDDSERATIPATHLPRLTPANDACPRPPGTKLTPLNYAFPSP